MRPIVIVLIACLAFTNGCKKPISESKEDSLTITLHGCANNIFSDSQVRLCFDSVISDSRCPANANCVWQGMAVCKFSFVKNSKTYPLILSTLALPGLYNKDTIVAGYKIEFINLLPYPGLPPEPAPGNVIRAEVKITKL